MSIETKKPSRGTTVNQLLGVALVCLTALAFTLMLMGPRPDGCADLKQENQNLRETLRATEVRLDQTLGETRRGEELLRKSVDAYLQTFEKEKFWREEYFRVVEREGKKAGKGKR